MFLLNTRHLPPRKPERRVTGTRSSSSTGVGAPAALAAILTTASFASDADGHSKSVIELFRSLLEKIRSKCDLFDIYWMRTC